MIERHLYWGHADDATINLVPDDVARTALLDLTVERGPSATISLTGELDPATAPELEEAIEAVLAEGTTRLVLDLGRLTFLDSSGLRVFVTARQALGERDGELVLRGPSANTQRLLDITGLGELITVE
ncbi:MAG: anti-sigma factor antagonist [Acidimicrobiales bacterium]|nr:anti-sigma factor antagonist [Acidimicrobiales bacterium]